MCSKTSFCQVHGFLGVTSGQKEDEVASLHLVKNSQTAALPSNREHCINSSKYCSQVRWEQI